MPGSSFHIAHVLPWSTVGGTERATLKIAQSVQGLFTHTAFCHGGRGPVQQMFAVNGFETVEYDAIEPSYRHPQFLAASFRLAREFQRRRVDLIHCSDLLGAYYAGIAGKIARLPVLCHVRCSYPAISRRDRSFLLTVNKFLFVSESTWRTFGHRVPQNKGVVVYDGMDVVEHTRHVEADSSVRRELNIPDDVLIIGMVARVTPAKDYTTLARAAARVIAENPAVRFLMVGDHSQVALNRSHYEDVKTMLASQGVAPYFIFTDHRDDVDRMISAMDIFVLSTHTEGLPLVILEAMAQAKPVVATAVGGVPEVVREGETGLLHAHEDDEMLANHLLSLMRDEELRHKLGAAGQAFAKERFTVASCAERMSAVYREALLTGT